jgi:hypothetical protein
MFAMVWTGTPLLYFSLPYTYTITVWQETQKKIMNNDFEVSSIYNMLCSIYEYIYVASYVDDTMKWSEVLV